MFYQQQPKWDVYFRMHPTGHNQIQNHLHGFFELRCCTEGQLHLVICGKPCVLEAGEAALIFPYQSHSFSKSGGKGFFFTFGPELIGTFTKQFANLLPVDNRFPFTYDFSKIQEGSDVYTIKSFLYAMCVPASKMEFRHAMPDSSALLEKMFLLTEEHFSDCEFSLGRLAALLEYDYGYLSKYFLKATGMKYHYYLNQRRITLAEQLLRKGEADSIADIAYACGYSSVRSFNRNFKEIEGRTPTQCLEAHQKMTPKA